MKHKAFEYALAIFSLANEQNQLTTTITLLQSFLASLDDSSRGFFRHPGIDKPSKKAVIESIMHDEFVRHCLFLLIDNQRFDELEEIVEEIKLLQKKQSGIVDFIVYSKSALSPTALESIKTKYTKELNRDVRVKNMLDSTLIAGVRLEFDGYVIDQTVSHYLQDLTASLEQ